jgi:hypothetical protein
MDSRPPALLLSAGLYSVLLLTRGQNKRLSGRYILHFEQAVGL